MNCQKMSHQKVGTPELGSAPPLDRRNRAEWHRAEQTQAAKDCSAPHRNCGSDLGYCQVLALSLPASGTPITHPFPAPEHSCHASSSPLFPMTPSTQTTTSVELSWHRGSPLCHRGGRMQSHPWAGASMACTQDNANMFLQHICNCPRLAQDCFVCNICICMTR